jgi:formate hydrogenlyase transcriptional activator
MNQNILHNRIEKLKFFEDFNTDELEYLSTVLDNPSSYPTQYELFKKGEIGNDMFIIISGGIQVSHNNRVLALLKKNDTLGETALLKKDFKRLTDAVALTHSQLLRISSHTIEEIESNNTAISSKIYKKIAESLAWKLIDSSKRDCKVFCIK